MSHTRLSPWNALAARLGQKAKWSAAFAGAVAISGCAAAPRTYTCSRAVVAPRVDGVLDDDLWQSAAKTEDFVDIVGLRRPRPALRTYAQLAWDEANLYIAAQLTEPHAVATLTQRDAIVFRDNDFEVFIDPNGDGRDYFEIEINAFNTIFDLQLNRPYRDDGKADHHWDVQGLRSAVHVDGTLNDPHDRDRGWSLEMAIPWSALADKAGAACPPRVGDTWRMNFSRVEWRYTTTNHRYEKLPAQAEENWVWSPQGEVNMHIPQRWGRVTFVRDR